MERALATAADADIILKLYDLRREPVMRAARAWMSGEFWPATAEEFFAVANGSDEHNAWFRQVTSYWEMAAAMVLHGAVSAELFIDCNGESLYYLAKFAPILDEIRAKKPGFMEKTSELIKRFPPAAERYAGILKNVEGMRARRAAK